MADKAQFYLEQTIPELKEFEKKKIFTKEEISAIIKKRSEFEHKVNTAGCRAIDYKRYIDYEMNLEALRKKRVKRLGVKGKWYTGSRKIFFLLARATTKFYGDLELWMQYIEFAKKEKSSRVLNKAFASVLKLHPNMPELWIYAAKHAMDENGNMTEARTYMQRGLRFNKNSQKLWLEYTKLELVYIAKIIVRRRLLGIDAPERAEVEQSEVQEKEAEEDDMIMLPELTAEDLNPDQVDAPQEAKSALDDPKSNAALSGAIPLAIFEAAVKEFPEDVYFTYAFFNLFAGFAELPFCLTLLDRTARYALAHFPTSPLAMFMDIKTPVVGMETTSPEFPRALGGILSKIAAYHVNASPRSEFYRLTTHFLVQYLKDNTELDRSLMKVIRASVFKYTKQAEAEGEMTQDLYTNWASLQKLSGKKDTARAVLLEGHKPSAIMEF